ncbi:MAG TPA: hypothetical protein VIV07_02605 [Sphingomicrobium sp.]
MTMAKPLLAASVLALCACGSNSAGNSANAAADPPENTAAAASAPAAVPAAAPAPAGAFNADYMVGKWSAVAENCAGTIDFRKDGSVTTPIGEAKWTVTGDKLSIDYHDGSEPTVSSVKVLGPARIELTHSSGTKETEKRC